VREARLRGEAETAESIERLQAELAAQQRAQEEAAARATAEAEALQASERAAQARAEEVAREVERLQAEQREREEAERAQAEEVRRLAGEIDVKEERTRQMAAEVERLRAEKERVGGSAEESGREIQQLQAEAAAAAKAQAERERDMEAMRREMDEVKRREGTQQSIIGRLKKEQMDRDKKDKALAQAAEEAAAQRAKVEEQLAATLLEMEALREAKAARESRAEGPAGIAPTPGLKKVELSPTEQAAFTAARHGRAEELAGLLDSVHVNGQNEAGNTLLIVAAQNNQKSVVKDLHNRGADLNSQNRLGQTALHFAFAFGSVPPRILPGHEAAFPDLQTPADSGGAVCRLHGVGQMACEKGSFHIN